MLNNDKEYCHFSVLAFRLNRAINPPPQHPWENPMPAMNLKSMDIDALLSLRADVDKRLAQKRSELEKQLSRLGDGVSRADHGRGSARTGRRTSVMKGRKVAPKFRGPGGETWAGRGARPRWLSALVKQGRKLEEFAINKTATARKGRRRKRK
jgi:DNA-binding protein H-NS